MIFCPIVTDVKIYEVTLPKFDLINIFKMKNIIKLILTTLLLLCLVDMPYGYYQFVRFVSCIAFAYFAYDANEKEEKTTAIIYLVLAILFQPFLKISLGRELWNIVDVIVGVGLMLTIFLKQKK
jgi:hypothetical protein